MRLSSRRLGIGLAIVVVVVVCALGSSYARARVPGRITTARS